MTIHFVGAGPGDPELITLKAHNLLTECDCCIWAGSLVNPKLLEYLKEGASIYDSASMDLEQIIEVMKKYHREGKKVVRLHTGDPAIYGAIAEQMRRLDKADIGYKVIPGVSSFQASAAALKMELTLPEVTQSIILSRVEGRTPVPEHQRLEVLAKSKSTLCLFLSISKLDELLERLTPFYGGDCPAAIVYKASWPEERVIKGTVSTLGELVSGSGITKTAMIVIGKAVAGEVVVESKLYDRKFTHEYREGKND